MSNPLYNLRMDPELYEASREAAKRRGMSFSELVRQCLAQVVFADEAKLEAGIPIPKRNGKRPKLSLYREQVTTHFK